VLIISFRSLIATGLLLITALFSVGIDISLLGIVASVITFGTASPTLALMIGLGVGIDNVTMVRVDGPMKVRNANRSGG